MDGLATPVVEPAGKALMAGSGGLGFFKMSGSGNDFVVFDARDERALPFAEPNAVRRLCERRRGVGADGVVFLRPDPELAFRMTYYNADGSRGSMCGNAALCSTRLAVELGLAPGSGFSFAADSGVVSARIRDGRPEIDLAPITDVSPAVELPLRSGERRMGFVLAGVPHLVVRCEDVEAVDVEGRGSTLRRHPSFAEGANVDFVAPGGGEGAPWAMRTYERGVEGETLACGTGAVSCALMLALWGEAGDSAELRSRSGLPLLVRLERRGESWLPSLGGEGRLVFAGELGHEW